MLIQLCTSVTCYNNNDADILLKVSSGELSYGFSGVGPLTLLSQMCDRSLFKLTTLNHLGLSPKG